MERLLAGRMPMFRRRARPSSASGGRSREAIFDWASGASRDLLDRVAPLLRGRRTRIALVCAALALALLCGAWLALRHSRFVAVRQVSITGVSGPESGAIEAALRREALQMSTLAASPGQLKHAVAAFRVVHAVRVQTHPPHGLAIEVSEALPVAALSVDGTTTAIAADGTDLGPALLSSSLPTIKGWNEPLIGRRVHSPELLAAFEVLAAAPPALGKYVVRAYDAPQRGLTLVMKNGLLVYFGDDWRPHAKWAALSAVLADQSSTGASYVDVRVPERPAAGFPDGVAPDAPEGSGEAGKLRSPVAALAESLSAGAGETTSSPTPATAEEQEAESSEGGEEPASEGAEPSTGEATEGEPESTSTETAEGGGSEAPQQ